MPYVPIDTQLLFYRISQWDEKGFENSPKGGKRSRREILRGGLSAALTVFAGVSPTSAPAKDVTEERPSLTEAAYNETVQALDYALEQIDPNDTSFAAEDHRTAIRILKNSLINAKATNNATALRCVHDNIFCIGTDGPDDLHTDSETPRRIQEKCFDIPVA